MVKVVRSAGIIMHKNTYPETEVLLCSPFSLDNKKPKVWGIPKGRINDNEEKLDAAIREFEEETGIRVPKKPMFFIGTFSYKSMKKTISAWAMKHDPGKDFEFSSNHTTLLINGRKMTIPEIGSWQWFNVKEAVGVIMPNQREMMRAFMSFVQKIK
jgi:predicted NUDIX family NTP pyrophosphohydrolase